MADDTKQLGVFALFVGSGIAVYILWEGWGREFFLGDGTPGSGFFGIGGPGKGSDTDGSGGNGPLPGLTPTRPGGSGGSGGSGSGTGGTGGSGSGSGTGGAGGSGGSGSGGLSPFNPNLLGPNRGGGLQPSPNAIGGAGGAGGAGTGGVGDYTALAAAINALANGVKLPNIKTAVFSISASGTTILVPSEGGKRVCVAAYAVTGPSAIAARFRSSNSAGDLWGLDLDATTGNSGANLTTAWPAYLFASQPSEALTINVTSACLVSVTYWVEAAV